MFLFIISVKRIKKRNILRMKRAPNQWFLFYEEGKKIDLLFGKFRVGRGQAFYARKKKFPRITSVPPPS